VATRIQLDFTNVGLDDYDNVCTTLNFPADWPDGLLAHTSVEVDGRLRVVDVWESPAEFDRFVEHRLGQAIGQALGERAEQPGRTETQLHTFFSRPT
jgi:hypothetical protein